MNIVVQKLSSVERPRVLSHLQMLSADDRYLRFGSSMQDEALAQYTQQIDFARDKIFGIYDAHTKLVAMAHLALDRQHAWAELGLSVDREYRGQGYGLALLNRAKLTAANRGYKALFMHCLAENQIMIHLARKAGLKAVIKEGQVDGELALGAPTYAGVALEAVEDQIALVDMLFRRRWRATSGAGTAV